MRHIITHVCALALLACGQGPAPEVQPEAAPKPKPVVEAPAVCPARAKAPDAMPRVTAEHRSAAYWLARIPDADAVLLTAAQVADHNAALRHPANGLPFTVYDLTQPPDAHALRVELKERFDWLAARFDSGKYVAEDGSKLALTFDPQPASRPGVGLHTVEATSQVFCAPTPDAFYTPSLDLRFNRNHCSSLRAGEVVRVEATWPNGMRLVRARYVYGWVGPDAKLSAATVALPGPPETKPITRRAVLEAAFRYLGSPYGWGGVAGGRDCSRFLMDAFGELGLELPRHSASQAAAGTFSVDVTKAKGEQEKLLLIDAAARRGLVLLHFPGHIMLYLGRDDAGVPMAIHAFAEYLTPCAETDPAKPDAVETLFEVDRVLVSDLELGRGSSRTAFVERITKVTVIGQAPGLELSGAAKLRPAAPVEKPESCKDGGGVAIYYSPKRPTPKGQVRIIATSQEDPGPVELTLVSPDGERVVPSVRRLGGPPFAYVATVESPRAGNWHALLGDGRRVLACEPVRVRRGKVKTERIAEVWPVRRRWTGDAENLYAAWVEHLFDVKEENVTWKSLHELTRNPERNLLYDHLRLGEDKGLRLQPDCADLPYLLRAYFAWKLQLPFSYRRCSRGRAGRPPTCGDFHPNTAAREKDDDVEAFQYFSRRRVRNGVHSASGRTAPGDDDTDFYPVPLTREALRPGTLYADPYGHMLVVARWAPQGLGGYGALIAADAQPDGTVGRRRFWRGSFLFTPSTKDVGAGFKAFRPIYTEGESEWLVRTNKELTGRDGLAPFSTQQYEGSKDDFYEAMDALINPRPLDPIDRQTSLVDALDEAVARRVNSVDNGIEFMTERGWRPIEMPTGYAVFETKGAWEDFSTPARDMRLLISVDTVLGLVDQLPRTPARFGLRPEQVAAAVAKVTAHRDRLLAERSFTYTRTDGAKQTMTLKQVIDRRDRFEMSYNPNDCPELRWAAREGDPEFASCQRRAPAAQTKRMKKYRPWFQNRQRPPR